MYDNNTFGVYFFGINARVYLNFDNMNATLEVILPLNLTVISVRFNLHNKTLYYNINKGKVRQINIKNNKRKNKKQFHKIRIQKFSYSMILGSNQDCVKGLYMANAIDYLSELFFNVSKKYLEINECCGEFGISVPTFRRYLSFLRDYFCENFSQEIIYDAENKKYILK